MHVSRQNCHWLIVVGVISLVSWNLAGSSVVPPAGPLQFVQGFPGSDVKEPPQLALFARVTRLVEECYVRELNDDQRQDYFEHAIQAALRSLDEHSTYIPPDEFRRFTEVEQGHFGGVGIQVGLHPLTQQLIVQTPIPDTPAFRAGLRSGDIILAVDGEQFSNLEDAVRRIKGPPGTTVKLTIRPWGSSEVRVVELQRAEIPIETVSGLYRQKDGQWWFWLDEPMRLAYVALEAFHPSSALELYQTLQRLQQQGLRGLVLDLRGNPGGRLETAVEIAELFLPTHAPIVTVRGRQRIEESYYAGLLRSSIWRHQGVSLPAFPNLPLVVLIDAHSASASEILASALQDNRRARLIGNRTFGKASVQTIIPLPYKPHALKLTTAEYLRPSGLNIHRYPNAKDSDPWGVIPDVPVKQTKEEQEQVLLANRIRTMLWQEELLQLIQERYDLSVALFGAAAIIDPDNALSLRTRLLDKQTDPVLERAKSELAKLIAR
jgi:carboxyl-terminal processing protease